MRSVPRGAQELTQRRGKSYKYQSHMMRTLNHGRSKVRCRAASVARNNHRLFLAAAPTNLYVVRRQLLTLPHP